MLFRPELIEKILSGQKTETRRVVRPHEFWCAGWRAGGGHLSICIERNGKIRTKWQEGKTYAAQPGRGKPAVARIRLLRIGREALHDITGPAVGREGFSYLADFVKAWNEINNRPGARWTDNPRVWVLEFELVG